MSKRTSEALKAIRQAWEKEQALVLEGKGTRDWSPEQQISIIEKGKAYDEDGKAFEGQHMLSVDAYPEYQGNPDNIQFLTRQEHLEAHDGNWQNPTNWYYNPITKEKTIFENLEEVKCPIIELSYPNYKICGGQLAENENNIEGQKASSVSGDNTQVNNKQKSLADGEPSLKTKRRLSLNEDSNKSSSISKIPNDIISNPMKHIRSVIKNPVVKEAGLKIGKGLAFLGSAAAIAVTVYNAISSGGANIRKSDTYENMDTDSRHETPNLATNDKDEIEDSKTDKKELVNSEENDNDIEKRSSPKEHTVSRHTQKYHTKNGTVEKEKGPYPRGGKNKKE